ncbi:IS1595 family transposase, partial [Pseudoduganella sp. GCM10020061]
LPNYLGWRWALDKHRIEDPLVMLRATVGVFPHLTWT